jgi:excisionase family DNA binding protein
VAERADIDEQRATSASPVPRCALRWPTEVAAALGVSVDLVQRHRLLGELRHVRLGRTTLVPVAELESWVDRNSRALMDADSSHARDGRRRR